MKKIAGLLITLWCLSVGNAAFSSTNCICRADYIKCKADGGLMSCLSCSRPGNICETWTCFGLAGCSCDSVENRAAQGLSFCNEAHLSVYVISILQFTRYLNQNGIKTDLIVNALKEMTSGLPGEKDRVRGDVVHPSAECATKFAEIYFREMETLRADPEHKKIIDDYLLTIQPE